MGNTRDVLISELAGRGTVIEKAANAGIELSDEAAARTVERVKELEHEGFQFEAADGSFELLMRQETGIYEELFMLISWRVIVEKRFDGEVESEATIKIIAPPGPEESEFICTAEGNGPVNALDKALRQAIGEHLSASARHRILVNFKVRILDEAKGTRGRHPRADRRVRRTARVGLDRRFEQRDRGILGRAGGLAGGCDPERSAERR